MLLKNADGSISNGVSDISHIIFCAILENDQFDTLNFKALLLFHVNWFRGKIIKKLKYFNAAQKNQRHYKNQFNSKKY